MEISRRHFLKLSAVSAAISVIPSKISKLNANPENTTKYTRPLAIASGNGLRGVELAYSMMTEKQTDPLDAAIAGVNIQELDPEEQGVGLGGRPNEDGIVQLDASCMHGPTKRAGAVAALEGIATASSVAKTVMDYTDHILLVGEGAKQFAISMGFKEQDLLTEKSRQDWLRWKARLNPDDNWLDRDDVRIGSTHGTINMCAVDTNGDIGSVTTTSGLSWKIPGRVSDSPIIGAGQYCDNKVGAAGSTGRGEANIKVCGAFYVVELMRMGVKPQEACRRALLRAIEMTEDRLIDSNGRPLFYLDFYALTKDGQFGGATIYESTPEELEQNYGFFAVANADGARLEYLNYLFKLSERPVKLIE
jgi:N4-(beta-N-acetylglucosaminyl)-L-asparaginase